jgi:hypothetical protein
MCIPICTTLTAFFVGETFDGAATETDATCGATATSDGALDAIATAAATGEGEAAVVVGAGGACKTAPAASVVSGAAAVAFADGFEHASAKSAAQNRRFQRIVQTMAGVVEAFRRITRVSLHSVFLCSCEDTPEDGARRRARRRARARDKDPHRVRHDRTTRDELPEERRSRLVRIDSSQIPRQNLVARAVATGLTAAAAALAVSTTLKAALDVSTTWDVWYYHLPFAARIFGIVPRNEYTFHALNEARYSGFPLLGEALQGFFWYVFQHPEAANFVALSSLGVFVVYLKYVFRVSLTLSTLALFAVPLVQTHASSCYVDLPANIAATVLLLSVFEAFAGPRNAEVPTRILLRAAFAAAVAANMRLQLNPIVLASLAILGARAATPLLADLFFRIDAYRNSNPIESDGGISHRFDGREAQTLAARVRLLRLVLASAVALPLIFASPIKNLAVHKNPVYPMKMAAFGITLDGPEDVYSDAPPYLSTAPKMQRFAYSLLEIGIRPITSSRRWTVDQWMPTESGGNRMGGFFSLYVVAHTALFIVLTRRERSRASRAAAFLFVSVTLIVANAPQSHELRYYMFWILLLVALNLAALARRTRDPKSRDSDAFEANAFGVAALTAVVFVATVTRFAYIVPSGYGFDALLRDRVSPETLANIEAHGTQMCIAKEPWTILYASTFHRPRRYEIVEAESEAQCDGARLSP